MWRICRGMQTWAGVLMIGHTVPHRNPTGAVERARNATGPYRSLLFGLYTVVIDFTSYIISYRCFWDLHFRFRENHKAVVQSPRLQVRSGFRVQPPQVQGVVIPQIAYVT